MTRVGRSALLLGLLILGVAAYCQGLGRGGYDPCAPIQTPHSDATVSLTPNSPGDMPTLAPMRQSPTPAAPAALEVDPRGHVVYVTVEAEAGRGESVRNGG